MHLFCRHVVYVCIIFYVQLINESMDTGATEAQETTTESFNFSVSSQTAPPDVNFTTEAFTFGPSEETSQPATTMFTATEALETPECLCDLTPDFCDIGCCCDTEDCGVTDLSTVFTACPQKAKAGGVCVEKWLMFRANVDSSLVTITDSLFCVQPEEKSGPITNIQVNYPALGDSYHFASPNSPKISSTYTRDFYRVDDVILAYFPKTSARGLLRLPSPAAASALCTDRNPAKFLRSSTSSCSREVTIQSCTKDPALSARSYAYNLNLVKHPILETDPVAELLIPVLRSSDWPAPSELNNSCINVVKRVEFVVEYTERGEILSAKVNISLANAGPEVLFLQTHSVQFQLIGQTNTASREQTPAVGLKPDAPVMGRWDDDDDVKPLTVIGVSQDGGCSSDPSTKSPILFRHNSMSGCTFTSILKNCSVLRGQIYDTLRGTAAPDLVAMNSGSKPDWTRVITEECVVGAEESCDTGCVLPSALSVHVLWAQQGLLQLPQNYILGVKYVFHCFRFKCPLTTPLTLSTQVTFADTTLYPEPPRGAPQPQWRFPFGFFSRGTEELGGHILSNSSGSHELTRVLIMFTILLMTHLV